MSKGVIAAGNKETAKAAAEVFNDGGTAFDAVIAGLFTSFVSEPVLSSPAGGGFLLAARARGAPMIFDFFVQTPGAKKPSSDLDFHPADATFSAATQEFHVGLGSVASPGMMAGLFDAHETLASMPIDQLAAPAVSLAKEGHAIDPLQSDILEVVKPIMLATEGARAIYESPTKQGSPLQHGEIFRPSALADTLDVLTKEGPRLFYEGEIAQAIEEMMEEGGSLTRADLKAYEVKHRKALSQSLRDVGFYTNPVPSSGGTLIALSLSLLDQLRTESHKPGSPDWCLLLANVMESINGVRRSSGFAEAASQEIAEALLGDPTLEQLEKEVRGRAFQVGGTTHISAADADGNLCAATVSNGEGCGHIVPGTGIMLNNMLGEEDLNPNGFFEWTPDTRISSMMAPSLIKWPGGRSAVLGSGGSNRIRTALSQVIANQVFFDLEPEAAVDAARIHFERGQLEIESGLSEAALSALKGRYRERNEWPGTDFFFGGVHVAEWGPKGPRGAGDPRRGGVVMIV